MTTAIKKTPGANYQYEFNVDANEIDQPLTEWAHDPDITAVADVARAYWKWDEETATVIPMTAAEMGIVDEYGKDAFDDYGNVVSVALSTDLPKSTIDGDKLAVHTSYKPEIEGQTTYAIWTGAGDDLNALNGGNGNGPLLQITTEVDVPESSVKIEFDFDKYGRVWIHEAYIKYTDGKAGDHISSEVYAYGVPVQQVAQLDLILDGDYIKYSPQGPGTGTHGFADPDKITVIDRSYSDDGDWDWSEENGLAPNFEGKGEFKISTVDKVVHRFINRIPCFGTANSYISLSSDETTELKKGYYAKLTAHNVSNTEWHVSALMELYRVVTYSE